MTQARPIHPRAIFTPEDDAFFTDLSPDALALFRRAQANNDALQRRLDGMAVRGRLLTGLTMGLAATFAVDTINRLWYSNPFVSIASGVLFVAGAGMAAVLCVQSLRSLQRMRQDPLSQNPPTPS